MFRVARYLPLIALILAVAAWPQTSQTTQTTHTTHKRSSTTHTSTTHTSVAIPAGTGIAVRMTDALSSSSAQVGDSFHGTLDEPIEVNGTTVFPKGADVAGKVTAAHPSGRLSDPGVLELTLDSVTSGTRTWNPPAEAFSIKGKSHTKSNVTKIGGGAAVGAVIGAIAGGGKGAAIGAGVGAAAGTGVAAVTGKQEASVESEAVLQWTTSEDSKTTRASATASTTGSAAASTTASTEPTASSSEAGTSAPPPRSYDEAQNNNDQGTASAPVSSFTSHDRRLIRDCFDDNAASLPPGLAKRESLPPGLERQVEKNGTLPAELQKRAVPMPEVCERQLPALPAGVSRVILGPHAMMVDQGYKVLDLFNLDQ